MPRGRRNPVDSLKASVAALIAENRRLKRRVAALEARKPAASPNGLAALARRAERALEAPTRRRRRRKVAS